MCFTNTIFKYYTTLDVQSDDFPQECWIQRNEVVVERRQKLSMTEAPNDGREGGAF